MWEVVRTCVGVGRALIVIVKWKDCDTHILRQQSETVRITIKITEHGEQLYSGISLKIWRPLVLVCLVCNLLVDSSTGPPESSKSHKTFSILLKSSGSCKFLPKLQKLNHQNVLQFEPLGLIILYLEALGPQVCPKGPRQFLLESNVGHGSRKGKKKESVF